MKLSYSVITTRPSLAPDLRRPIKPPVCFSSDIASQSTRRTALSESLQSDTLNTLEWPSVCNQVSAFTSTTMGFGAANGGRIPLGRSLDESRKLLAQTAAALALPRLLDFSGIEDVSDIVDSSVAGELVSIVELCSVMRTLRSARALLKQLETISLESDSAERYSPLLEILQNCNFLTELEQKVTFCIDCNFSIILDRASEDLEIIRSERKRNMKCLESLLKQVSTQIFQAGGIDRPLITWRRSRMCVGIKASHKSLLQDGIILNISSSGATYFMEPKEAVELNNMEIRLSNSEKVEEHSILSLLTSEIADWQIEIMDLLDRVLEIDLACARAAHARWMSGAFPVITSNACDVGIHSLSVDIEGMQHPLLLETSLRSLSDLVASKSVGHIPFDGGNSMTNSDISSGASDFPVPIDIKINRGTRVVVISGPNTGGKTASMKTLGLASLMSKAGMYLPARNFPRLPWFDLILADIGDQQSLEQNLSTFSGRITKLCKIIEVASEESLVLIDEIGCGTDPSEGVALSTSILQYLKDRVNLIVVTTHYAELTLLKEKDNLFENAAMEFSLQTLQPTYRILWGRIGESNALDIAKSLNFNEKIIARAQSWVGKLTPEKQKTWKSLLHQSLMEERQRLGTQERISVSLHSDVMDIYNEIRAEAEDLEGRARTLMAKEIQTIQQEILAAKFHIQKVVQDTENQLKTAGPGEFSSLLKKSESAITSILEAHTPADDISDHERVQNLYTPQIGEQVCVKVLGNKLATVVAVPGDDSVLVKYGKMRVRVKLGDLKVLQNSNERDAKSSVLGIKREGQHTGSSRNFSEPSVEEQASYGAIVQTSKNTVDLRGMRVEEASHQLNMAISSRGSNSVLFIIHGMGTGAVKQRALDILRKHPRVAKFEQGSPMNYGCTVAYIK